MNALKGSCHCGNVEFTLHTEKDEHTLVPRRCGCSMCRRHGATWISDPDGRLELRCRDEAGVGVYMFAHRTSRWILCARCGVLMAVVSRIDGRLRAVVRTQPMVDHVFKGEVPMDFDGESVDERLARRSRTWIGSVTLTPMLDLAFDGPQYPADRST
jgi:hypothetical protein